MVGQSRSPIRRPRRNFIRTSLRTSIVNQRLHCSRNGPCRKLHHDALTIPMYRSTVDNQPPTHYMVAGAKFEREKTALRDCQRPKLCTGTLATPLCRSQEVTTTLPDTPPPALT